MAAESYVLITGGAGFIGANLAQRLAEAGKSVLLYDDLSRPGVEENVRWLFRHYASSMTLLREDIRNEECVREAVAGAEAVFHLAARTEVEESLKDPVREFEVNTRGTLNVLEAIRQRRDRPFLLHASTYKVYGSMEDVVVSAHEERYAPECQVLSEWGISETRALANSDLSGCSRGAAEQYVLEYGRSFQMPCSVFRISGVYGPRQVGSPVQSFAFEVAKQAISGAPVTLSGDGRQVCDFLSVDDLVDALVAAWKMKGSVPATAFNIGGGPALTASQIELVRMVEEISGCRLEARQVAKRPFHPLYYASDFRKFHQLTGWRPKTGLRQGIAAFYRWLFDQTLE